LRFGFSVAAAAFVIGTTLGELLGHAKAPAWHTALEKAAAPLTPPTNEIDARTSLVPQEGPQSVFLASEADIRIYGGSVYGGKTWALTRQPLEHIDNAGFNFVVFRRTTPEIKNPGGVWDESAKMYPQVGANARETTLDWYFPSGARGKMAGLQYESDVRGWKSAQICALIFDQLEEFLESQFFYMLSRNRSTCGVKPYVLAACNPDPDSFLATFLAWWLDLEGANASGYAIPERSGSVRWFIRVDDAMIWSDVTAPPDAHGEEFKRYDAMARADLEAKHPGQGQFAYSVTFVLARLRDNKIGVQLDPGYEKRIRAMSLVDQERLLGGDRGGNWKIRAGAGLVFNSTWFDYVEPGPLPGKVKARARGWDKAATAGGGDWTWGVLQAHYDDGTIVIEDCEFGQWAPGDRDAKILETAKRDGPTVLQIFEQEPGASGVSDRYATTKMLAGYRVEFVPSSGDKVVRAGPIASQARIGLVKLVRNPIWNATYVRLLHAFPTKGVPDDPVDGTSVAYNKLTQTVQPRMRSLS
jgi:predicted phage terminase large subunit-like protein